MTAVNTALLDDALHVAQFTRMDASAQTAESSLQLSGLHCAACAGLIESALRAQAGVLSASVHHATSRVTVRWQPARTRVSLLVGAIQAAGYDAVPDTAADARLLRQREQRRLLWRLFVASFCAMQVMMLATPSYVADPGTLAPDLAQLLDRSAWMLSLPVMFFSATPFFTSAWSALRAGRLSMDVPVALGVLVAFVASSGAAFDPGGIFGREVYFDSLTMFVSFLLGARWLELRARHRAVDVLESAGRVPLPVAWRACADGSYAPVPVDRLVVGDRVRVPMGEVFPADGVITMGTTSADESLLTGESRPVDKPPGSVAVAGSLNLGATVEQRVDRVGADTRQAQIAALTREALTCRPRDVQWADRIAGPFLAAVLCLSLGAAAVWWLVDPTRAVWVMVSVLIVTCPCALSLAAPATWLAATSALTRHGVLLRRMDALETLAKVQHVLLDKTGTLTQGAPVFRGAAWREPQPTGLPVDGPLRQAASLAAWSTHPWSRALVAACPGVHGDGWLNVREVVGSGVEGYDTQGKRWRLGSSAWLGAGDAAEAPLYFGASDGPTLALSFDEALCPDAAQGVQALQRLGLRITLLSGDAAARVLPLARRLNIDDVVADATPETKLATLRAHQARGTVVCMVGDGVNDAPVLAQANVSFAVMQGASMARLAADAVLLRGRVGDVARAVHLARRSVRVMRQNLGWAALYNALSVPLALMGYLPPWAAGLGMAASSALVVLNASRVARVDEAAWTSAWTSSWTSSTS
jgi:P-type Cu2+ transporter